MRQRFRTTVSAKASVAGTAIITFPSVPTGLVWTFSTQVVNSETAAVWTAIIGGSVGPGIGAWTGVAPFGPLQLLGSDSLSLVGTGLVSGTTYYAVIVGYSQEDDESAPFLTVTPSSATAVAVGGTVSSVSGSVGSVVGGVGGSVAGNVVGTVKSVTVPLTGDPAMFGNGSDGAVTLGNNTTLTRDMNYTTLNVQGFTLNAHGFRVRANTSITIAAGGSINNDGSDATAPNAAVAFAFGFAGAGGPAGTLPGGNAGGDGSSDHPVTAATIPTNVNPGAGGWGGNGGSGGSQAASQGGTVTNGPLLMASSLANVGFITQLNGGAGGGGGGITTGLANASAGGGGGGGGSLSVASPIITNNGRISCNGGNGSNGSITSTGAASGGGGGGGGILVALARTYAGIGTYQCNGGTGGTQVDGGAGGTSNGIAGNPGFVLQLTAQ